MPRETKYEPGTHNINCAVCTKECKFRDMEKNWDGTWVCPEDKEDVPASLQPVRRMPQDPKPAKEVQKTPEGPDGLNFLADFPEQAAKTRVQY